MSQNNLMNFHQVRHYPDPSLLANSLPVQIFDDKLASLIEKMNQVMLNAPGIGLAGSQIGVNLRVFVWQTEDSKGHIINPTITLGDEFGYDMEGCLSLPDLFCETRRATSVELNGFNQEGQEIKIVGKGFLARVFQHEYDHINGILFMDRLDEEAKPKFLAQMRKSDWYRL